MRIGKMLELLPAGKKFRRAEWPVGRYVEMQFDKTGGRTILLQFETGKARPFTADQEALLAGDYEVC